VLIEWSRGEADCRIQKQEYREEDEKVPAALDAATSPFLLLAQFFHRLGLLLGDREGGD